MCLLTEAYQTTYLFLIMKFISFNLLDLFPYSVGDKASSHYSAILVKKLTKQFQKINFSAEAIFHTGQQQI